MVFLDRWPSKLGAARLLPLPLLLLGAACGGSSPSPQPELLLSRVQLALVVGGSATVQALDPTGFPAGGSYLAESTDEAVVTATAEGDEVTVTGVGLGRATVRVSGPGGARELPIQIYDPTFLETEELTLAFTDQFTHSGMTLSCAIDTYDCAWGWQPLVPEGFWTFGTYFTKSDGPSAPVNPNGTRAVMIAKPKTDTALAHAASWTYLGNYRYRAVCPDDYRALGEMIGNADAGWMSGFACVRADLTSPGSLRVLRLSGNNYASSQWGLWEIVAPDPPPTSGTYFNPGTAILGVGGHGQPVGDPSVNALKVDFGLLDEAPPQVVVPRLMSLVSLQGMENSLDTAPTVARAMLVPCTAIRDPYWTDIPTRVKSSPFYRLEQQVFYRLKRFFYNQTSLVQEPYFELTKGISETETSRFEVEAGVTISYEAGVSLDFFSAGVTTSVSLSFGFSTERSVQEFVQETTHIPFAAAPGKATAVWQQYNRFVLYRHNGTRLEQVSAPVELGTNSYVVDEYPD